MKLSIITSVVALLAFTSVVSGGPVAYGICQSGRAALVCACYSTAGATFGTVVAAAATPAAVTACNAVFGACSAKCAIAFWMPTP